MLRLVWVMLRLVRKPRFWAARDAVIAVAKGGNLFALACQAHSVEPDDDANAVQ